ISGKACVRYGHDAEAPIRELFALDHPQYIVQYGGAFDMVRSADHPWLFATLDGRLIERSTGRRGVYEGKTTEILRSQQLEKWTFRDERGQIHGRVPDNYYVQLLHQLLATGWDFAVLNCRFKRAYPDGLRFETRSYRFDREDLADDLAFLLGAETAFWRCVQENTSPALILPEI
ncbi:MAG: YqaJ viral recombinase family protein, partial [Gemmiger sp.]